MKLSCIPASFGPCRLNNIGFCVDWTELEVICYDTITMSYFNVCSKANINQLNIPHGTKKWLLITQTLTLSSNPPRWLFVGEGQMSGHGNTSSPASAASRRREQPIAASLSPSLFLQSPHALSGSSVYTQSIEGRTVSVGRDRG